MASAQTGVRIPRAEILEELGELQARMGRVIELLSDPNLMDFQESETFTLEDRGDPPQIRDTCGEPEN